MIDEKHYLSWTDIENFVDSLAMHLNKQNFKPNGVYGIPRGGLIPAVMVSHRLAVPMLLAPIKGCIVVDDIVDTGQTILGYKSSASQTGDYFIATIIQRTNKTTTPADFTHKEITGDQWVVFPWEGKR